MTESPPVGVCFYCDGRKQTILDHTVNGEDAHDTS
eukprot:gene13075-13983_t